VSLTSVFIPTALLILGGRPDHGPCPSIARQAVLAGSTEKFPWYRLKRYLTVMKSTVPFSSPDRHGQALCTLCNLSFKVDKGEQAPRFSFEGNKRPCQGSAPPKISRARRRRTGDGCFASENCKAARRVVLCPLIPLAYTHSAEIDRLQKIQAAKSTKPLEEIPRPPKIRNLQHDMGLADDKKKYLHCRVSFSLSHFQPIFIVVDGSGRPGASGFTT
jgi:hypothetical protein